MKLNQGQQEEKMREGKQFYHVFQITCAAPVRVSFGSSPDRKLSDKFDIEEDQYRELREKEWCFQFLM